MSGRQLGNSSAMEILGKCSISFPFSTSVTSAANGLNFKVLWRLQRRETSLQHLHLTSIVCIEITQSRKVYHTAGVLTGLHAQSFEFSTWNSLVFYFNGSVIPFRITLYVFWRQLGTWKSLISV